MSPRLRWLRSRRMLLVLTIVGLVQIPGIAAVAHFTGSWLFAIGGAVLVSLPFVASLRSPLDDRPSRPLLRYSAVWPFYTWWASCLTLALAAPLCFALAWAMGTRLDHGLYAACAVSLFAGLRASRRRLRVSELDIVLPGLAAELDGFRIVQLSDVHCGHYTPPARVASWVERINALEPDLVAITGDLITSGSAYVAAVAEALGGLRAPSGVFACMGNHDYFTDGERLVGALESSGVEVLRNHGRVVISGDDGAAQLFVAGVDDTWTGRADVERAVEARPANAVTLLLAHDPNLFPQAAERGVELTLSGHTHGGQFAAPVLKRTLNLARFITPFTTGLYRLGGSLLYVSRGAGTTGPPLRLGAPSEITLLTLRAAD